MAISSSCSESDPVVQGETKCLVLVLFCACHFYQQDSVHRSVAMYDLNVIKGHLLLHLSILSYWISFYLKEGKPSSTKLKELKISSKFSNRPDLRSLLTSSSKSALGLGEWENCQRKD